MDLTIEIASILKVETIQVYASNTKNEDFKLFWLIANGFKTYRRTKEGLKEFEFNLNHIASNFNTMTPYQSDVLFKNKDIELLYYLHDTSYKFQKDFDIADNQIKYI